MTPDLISRWWVQALAILDDPCAPPSLRRAAWLCLKSLRARRGA